MNFIPAVRSGKDLHMIGEKGYIELPQYQEALNASEQNNFILGIRPEDILFYRENENMHPIHGILNHYEHLGNRILLYADFSEFSLCISAPLSVRAKVGEEMTVFIDKEKVHLFDAKTEVHL